MTSINKNISIEEFEGKKFQIQFFEPENSAFITHYLHNYNNGVKKIYEEKANYFFTQFLEYKQKTENIKLIAEDALQMLLFEVEDVPFPTPEKYTFKFIDLFAGIGGFRLALQNLGGKCVFSSEWDKEAKRTYQKNFGEVPFGDITKEFTKTYIPEKFDVLCAGFPCQPFSKGGFQNGFEDTRGTLFFDICEIVQKHKPKFLFLENVANLVTHDNGNTYKVILKNLNNLGYYFPEEPLILSPDKFGIPTLRPRVYIPCVRKDIAGENIDFIKNFGNHIKGSFAKDIDSIDSIINFDDQDNTLTDYEMKVLNLWNDFYKGIDLKVIGFPIWADFFKYDGDFSEFPEWKQKFVKKNVDLYHRNKKFIDKWLKKNSNLDWVINTHRKLEWQAGDSHDDIFSCLIQFRPSGVRVKKADKFSTLVAMNHQQIIGKLKRKISIEESKLLQSFPKEYQLNSTPSIALKQLGNSVNVNVVQIIFQLLKEKFND